MTAHTNKHMLSEKRQWMVKTRKKTCKIPKGNSTGSLEAAIYRTAGVLLQWLDIIDVGMKRGNGILNARFSPICGICFRFSPHLLNALRSNAPYSAIYPTDMNVLRHRKSYSLYGLLATTSQCTALIGQKMQLTGLHNGNDMLQ